MARPELLDRIKPLITLDKKTESVLVRNLLVRDHDVFDVMYGLKELERAEFLKKAVKVGVIALKDVALTEKVDYVKREFEMLRYSLEKILGQQLGNDGMKGELDKIFGDEGKLQNCLDQLFGNDGKFVHDILDMNNINSPIGQLKKTIESYFVGKDSEVYNMLDPNSTDSPISRLRKELSDKLDRMQQDITVYLTKKGDIAKSIQKGFDFEDTVEGALLRWSKPFGDIVEKTAKEKGKMNNLKGDFVLTLCDPSIKGKPPKIVIEAKTLAKVRVTLKGLLGELREAIENRDANFAIAVSDTVISDSHGCYREVEGDKIICAYGDDGLPFEVAYRIARTYLLMRIRSAPERTLDITKICGIVAKIGNDLDAVRGIRTKLNTIGATAETIGTDVKSLETNIRLGLNELQDILNQGAGKTSDKT